MHSGWRVWGSVIIALNEGTGAMCCCNGQSRQWGTHRPEQCWGSYLHSGANTLGVEPLCAVAALNEVSGGVIRLSAQAVNVLRLCCLGIFLLTSGGASFFYGLPSIQSQHLFWTRAAACVILGKDVWQIFANLRLRLAQESPVEPGLCHMTDPPVTQMLAQQQQSLAIHQHRPRSNHGHYLQAVGQNASGGESCAHVSCF